MVFKYTWFHILLKKIYRTFVPVPRSPWTNETIDDICSINLVPPQELEVFFKDSFQLLKSLKGEDVWVYLEFGVFNGSSISSAYKAAQGLNLWSITFFWFDAFEGLPSESEHEDNGVRKKWFYACSFDQMRHCMMSRGINPDQITRVKGRYQQTLVNKTAEEHAITNIGIAFIDCDTYSSSKSVLDFLAPLLKNPTIICLDDWKLNNLDIKDMGEYKAFHEFLNCNPHLRVKEIKSYNRKSKSFLVIPQAEGESNDSHNPPLPKNYTEVR